MVPPTERARSGAGATKAYKNPAKPGQCQRCQRCQKWPACPTAIGDIEGSLCDRDARNDSWKCERGSVLTH